MKKELNTFEDALEFAIAREQDAEDFYRCWAGQVSDDAVSALFEEFAEEERLHQEKLVRVKQGQRALLTGRPAPRFRTPLDVTTVKPQADMKLADAFAVAIKKEKAAYRFYLDMAVDAPTEALMKLFLDLAREEANHKVRFEIEYDGLTVAG